MPSATISGVIWNDVRQVDFGAVREQDLHRLVVVTHGGDEQGPDAAAQVVVGRSGRDLNHKDACA